MHNYNNGGALPRYQTFQTAKKMGADSRVGEVQRYSTVHVNMFIDIVHPHVTQKVLPQLIFLPNKGATLISSHTLSLLLIALAKFGDF